MALTLGTPKPAICLSCLASSFVVISQCSPQVRHEAAEPRREAAGATEAAHRHQAKFLLVTVTFRICLRLYVCIAITKLVKAPGP